MTRKTIAFDLLTDAVRECHRWCGSAVSCNRLVERKALDSLGYCERLRNGSEAVEVF